MNQKAIRARLDGELTEEDFTTLKRGIAEEIFQIEAAITALDSERSTMQDMMQQAKLQVINLAETWKHSSAEQRQEMVRAFFPAGIWYSQATGAVPKPTDRPHCGSYHLAEVRIKNSAAAIIAAKKTFRSRTFSTPTPDNIS